MGKPAYALPLHQLASKYVGAHPKHARHVLGNITAAPREALADSDSHSLFLKQSS